MVSLFWQTVGTGNHDLVLLHGWGLNAEVWFRLVPKLIPYFRLHLVDLPGYGRSYGYRALTLEEMADELVSRAPHRALWLGWSLGGLVATTIASRYPNLVSGLITVASSPYFCAESNWPGIKSEALEAFESDLCQDFTRTVIRFLNLQTLGTTSSQQDMRWLKKVIMAHTVPETKILTNGLSLLRSSDMRKVLKQLEIPLLRLYGYLDILVPNTVVPLVDKLNPSSQSIIFIGAAHALFVSHPTLCCQALYKFSKHVSCTTSGQ